MGIISDIREPLLASLRDDVAAGRRENALVSLRERGVSKDLVRQQYSGRYPFELLQNANDAATERGVLGHALFEVTETALIVADNGSGFSDENVRAICTLGDSSKDPAKSVGYKGLGFKSVGEITDAPQIVTRGVSFGFDADRARREIETAVGQLSGEFPLPTYAVPFEIGAEELGTDSALVEQILGEDYSTVFRLPYKPGVTRSEVERHVLETLLPRLLLFLRSTEQLEVRGTSSGDFVGTIDREVDINTEYAVLDVSGETSSWLIYQKRVPVPPMLVEPMGEAWSQVREVGAGVAVEVGTDDAPQVEETFPLHVYFPTDELSGLRFVAHADWALHLDRRQLATSPEASGYNRWLCTELATFVVDHVAGALADRYPGTAQHLQVLSPTKNATGHGAEIRDMIIEGLKQARVVPVTSGELVLPSDARVLPPGPDINETHAMSKPELLTDVVIPEADLDPSVCDLLENWLGVRAISGSDILDALVPPTADTIERYYRFLAAWDSEIGRRRFLAILGDRPFVLIESGSVVSPTARGQRVFFPRESDGAELPAGLPVPVAKVPDVPGIEGLLREAGVQDFRWRELVIYHLVPILESPESTEPERALALEGLRAYLSSQRTGDQQVRDAVGRTLLPSRRAMGGAVGLRRAEELYFGSDWTGRTALERLYGPFEQADFLAASPDSVGDDVEEWRELYAFLGVADMPRLVTVRQVNRDTWMTGNLSKHPHRLDPSWASWWPSVVESGGAECPSGQHGDSQQLRVSHQLDRLHPIVESGDVLRLFVLWEELARGWVSTYGPALQSTFHCQHGWHKGPRDRPAPSLLLHALQSTAWVPCVCDGKLMAAMPDQVWRRALDTSALIGRLVPTLPDDMQAVHARTLADELGITDAARPKPDELVALLERLAIMSDDDATNHDELAQAARWAMSTLNRVLGYHPESTPKTGLRLVARRDGDTVFVESPVVAKDPLLRETFAADLPIVDVDSDLSRAFEYFGLVDLDSEVGIAPHDLNPRPDLREAIEAQVDEAKPWLLALIRHSRPSETSTARGRLGRLDFQICENLALEYTFGQLKKRRDDATSYIAIRSQALSGAVTRIYGTAHLEIDLADNAPNWYVFGPQLANYLRAENLGDAFTTILTSNDAQRRRFMEARRIHNEDVAEARALLGIPIVEEEAIDIQDLLNVDDIANLSNNEAEFDTESQPSASKDGTEPTEPEDSGTASAPVQANQQLKFPPLNLTELEVEEPTPETVETRQPWQRVKRPGGSGLPRPSVESEAMKLLIGVRGEEAALAAEQGRVRDQLGRDPRVVVWRAEIDPYSPWDIESIDDDGSSIYIEVKSTTGEDPESDFLISRNELVEALRLRQKYFIYRVTEAHTANPRVHRFADPIGRLLNKTAAISMADARMRLGASSIEGDPDV